FTSCIFFFFQAEDGIRDFHVTGVQTCALPISLAWWRAGAIVLGAALIVVAFGRITDLPNRPYVARVEVSGIITQDLELNRLLQRSEERRVGKECRTRG